jgi:hypothetical protein
MYDLVMCMGVGLLCGLVPMLIFDVFSAAVAFLPDKKSANKDRVELFVTMAGMGGCVLGLLGAALGTLLGLTVGAIRAYRGIN